MVKEIILPKQGLQMEEGLLVRWLKAPGDRIVQGEAVAEMETDKANISIESATDGVLLKIMHEEGSVVPVGGIIAWVGDSMDDSEKIPETDSLGLSVSANAEPETLPMDNPPDMRTFSPAPAPSAPSGGRVFCTPRARMRAEERAMPLASIVPSGPENLIIERDVLSSESVVTGKRIPFNRTRRYIADKMLASLREKAQTTHTMHLDMSALIKMRNGFKGRGINISYNDLMIKGCAAALRQYPELNRTVEGGEMVQHSDVHIGLAVATDGGLMVPVIKNAHWINVETIAKESRRLVAAVHSGTLSAQDAENGTFTISNLGMFDIDEFQAVINPPQSAILAVGRISDRVVVVDGMIGIRPMCTVTLTYDHCVVDGAPAARFMKALQKWCECPFD